jgi:uncharacterized protein (DUF2141 family)
MIRNSIQLITVALLLITLLGLQACHSMPRDPDPRTGGQGTIIVTVTGMPNDKGQVLINLFIGPDGFPGDVDKALRAIAVPVRNGSATVRLEDVPAGPFAISAFHDQDMDKELDTNVFGIPTEHWGDLQGRERLHGAARAYDDARLELEGGSDAAARRQARRKSTLARNE